MPMFENLILFCEMGSEMGNGVYDSIAVETFSDLFCPIYAFWMLI